MFETVLSQTTYNNRLNASVRSQLTSFWPDIEKICKTVKRCAVLTTFLVAVQSVFLLIGDELNVFASLLVYWSRCNSHAPSWSHCHRSGHRPKRVGEQLPPQCSFVESKIFIYTALCVPFMRWGRILGFKMSSCQRQT